MGSIALRSPCCNPDKDFSMGAIALGSQWLQSRQGFPMGAIALGSPWVIQIINCSFLCVASSCGFHFWPSLVLHVLVLPRSSASKTLAMIFYSSVTRTSRTWRTTCCAFGQQGSSLRSRLQASQDHGTTAAPSSACWTDERVELMRQTWTARPTCQMPVANGSHLPKQCRLGKRVSSMSWTYGRWPWAGERNTQWPFKISPGKETQDLTHIVFGLHVRDRLYEAGTAACVELFMSRIDRPALSRHWLAPESASFVKALGKTQLSSAPALRTADFFFILLFRQVCSEGGSFGLSHNFFCHLIIPTRGEGPRRLRPEECSISVRFSIWLWDQSVTAWKVAVQTVQHLQASRHCKPAGSCPGAENVGCSSVQMCAIY